MKIKFKSFIKKEQNGFWIEPENKFEESVFKDILGEHGVFVASTYSNGVHLEKMPEDINKLLQRYYKRKAIHDALHENTGVKDGTQ